MQIPARGFVFDAIAAGPADGDPVLLLHGFPQTSRAWRRQLDALGDAGYRAVAFDQRGYSPDARPDDPHAYRTTELVADVVGVADELGFDRFHLVGHDWGGAIAWQIAGHDPQRLRTLTVVSTPHPAAMRKSIREGEQAEKSSYMRFLRSPEAEDRFLENDAGMLKAMYAGSGLPEDDAVFYTKIFSERAALTGGLNWYRAADITMADGMGEITMPTMYVWSTEDIALGREAAEWTGDYVSGPYRFEVLEGVLHWVCELAPDDLNRLLLSHLGGDSGV